MDTVLPAFVRTYYSPIPPSFGANEPGSVSAKVHVWRADDGLTIIELTGFCLSQARELPGRKVNADEVQYTGRRRGVTKAAFRMLRSVALAYPSGKVLYQDEYPTEF